MKLNLGCGRDIKTGYINSDEKKLPGVEKVINLNSFPYPYKNESIDEIYMSHVLEHLEDDIRVLKECHRIIKKEGKVRLRVPFVWNTLSFTSTHKHYYHAYYFNEFMKNDNDNYIHDFSFSNVITKYVFEKSKLFTWIVAFGFVKSIYTTSFLSKLFPSKEIEVILTK